MANGRLIIFKIDLSLPPCGEKAPVEILSRDEIARAESYKFASSRDQFIIGRTSLRRILAEYLGQPPEQIVFTYGPHGRPEASHSRDVSFNFSNSGSLAVCAVSTQGHVGIDIEKIRPLAQAEQIVASEFTPVERSAFYTLPETERSEALLKTVTKKEATLKATGAGLSIPLKDVVVSENDSVIKLLGRRPERFNLAAFAPETGYVGAVAYSGPNLQIEFKKWA